MLIKIYLCTLAAASALTFVLFAADKYSAGKGKRRVPEIVLLSCAGFGGAAGALPGMYLLRHKTVFRDKFHFAVTVWLSAAVQLTLGIYIAVWGWGV